MPSPNAAQLKRVMDTLRELMTPPTEPALPKNPIGFVQFAKKPLGKPKAIKSKTTKGQSADG